LAGSFTSLYYHLIFSTKNRQPLISPDLRERLWEYMGGVLHHHGCSPVIIGGTADHAHVLCVIGKEQTVAAAVRDLKTNSSRWVHETFPELASFAWQEGYAAFTLHSGLLERARKYIAEQEAHHRQQTFQEEFVAFLRRHGVPYDERYLWG
jgi:putative transposase